jgi:thiamine biosynthesis lipoprotein
MALGQRSHLIRDTLIAVVFISIGAAAVICTTQPEQSLLVSREFVQAGTFVKVTSPDPRASDIVVNTFKRLEKLFNLYDSESQISLINARAGIAPVSVDDEMIEILKLSRQLHDMTGGAFDVSIGGSIGTWKALMTAAEEPTDKPGFPDKDQIAALKEQSGMEYVEIDEQSKTVFITRKGVALDLGGIAKGYMVDSAVNALRAAGIGSALIDAGGDVYCLGDKQGKPWHIGIREPALEGIMQSIDLTEQGVATSGNYEQYFEYEGKKYSHIIDPRTMTPSVSTVESVTVVAHNLTTADGLATAFFVMGPQETAAFLKRNLSNMRVFFMTRDGENRDITILGDANF